eukprot:TRINITY_DN7590_c0_g1_i1.p1 TRINITY_DN7590_c0_g1~~TRINITY_DN7590_c0_g1_i1.p1  ORF type:complete len:222 (+),score=48.54 TRINITY_DN7590_c0_g1_i1:54-719(+)
MDPAAIAERLARIQKEKEEKEKAASSVNEMPAFGAPSEKVTTTKITKGAGTGIAGFTAKKKNNTDNKKKINEKCLRVGGDGSVWEDPTMAEWADNDFRLFVGNLGNDVNTEMLAKHFSPFGSFLKAKVIKQNKSSKVKGYGFVSFAKPEDALRARREMDGKHIGLRPVTVQQGKWSERQAGDTKAAVKQVNMQKSKRNRKYHHDGIIVPAHYEPYSTARKI